MPDPGPPGPPDPRRPAPRPYHDWRMGPFRSAGGDMVPDPLHDPTAARPPDPDGDAGRVLAYHERSKHHRHAYAPAPAALDWANQPDPFRTFAGAPAVEL